MGKTVYNLDEMMHAQSRRSVSSERSRRPSLVLIAVGTLAVVVSVATFVQGRKHANPNVLYQAYTLPAPKPLMTPPPVQPVIVANAPVAPQLVRIPPARPSLWEIRAELKRGLGEWELPHYVNAPHYGSGPDSPLPGQVKPHLATAYAEWR